MEYSFCSKNFFITAIFRILTPYISDKTDLFKKVKQIRFLERMGFRNVAKWTKVEAQKIVQRIRVCNWRIPAGITPETYTP